VRRRLLPVAVAVAAGVVGGHAIAVWIFLFRVMPVHEDVRMTYVAAQAGLRYGWSSIYDQATLRALSASFPPGQTTINDLYTYVHPPLVAWLFAPLTMFPEPFAYLVWTMVALAALVLAWHIAAPFTAGFAKASVLLLSIGLWPMLSAFYYGQPVALVVACIAVSWWLVEHDRPAAAGAAIAAATFLKPQLIWMLPFALVVSGRVRVFAAWAAGCALVGAICAIALGPGGITGWIQAIDANQADPAHTVNTLIHFFGLGVLTVSLWALFAAGALTVAYRRRREAGIVFAVGLLGTALVAFHFHELDYSIVILAAWFFLRTSPPLWQRLWLIPGIGALELLAVANFGGPAWDGPSHGAAIVWAAGWLAILVGNALTPARATTPHGYELARTSST
jgi:Glycosyltransferase family 87